MNLKNKKFLKLTQVSSFFTAVLILKYFDIDVLPFTPLFMLCAEGGCCGGGSSTPFLKTWNGSKYEFENDFLFGKPNSLFRSKIDGLLAYENGNVSGDLYKIQNEFKSRDGVLSFQINEVEPEESYIDSMSLVKVIHNKDSEILVNSDFAEFKVFTKESLDKKEGIVSQLVLWNSSDVTSTLGSVDSLWSQDRDLGRFMNADKDVIEIKGKVENKSNDIYLVLKSNFRDWILEDIFENNQTDKISWTKLMQVAPKSLVKVGALALVFWILNAATAVGTLFKNNNYEVGNTDEKSLVSSFGISRVSADIPVIDIQRSFVVSYWTGISFEIIDIHSPRYYQPDTNIIRIPKEAISEAGEFYIKITATKKHKIYHTAIISPYQSLVVKSEILKVSKATLQRDNKDYSTILNMPHSGEYLHTIPADVVDLAFENGKLVAGENEKETYLLQASGFYTDLSAESRSVAGDWLSKLDNESREWLKEMYVLGGTGVGGSLLTTKKKSFNYKIIVSMLIALSFWIGFLAYENYTIDNLSDINLSVMLNTPADSSLLQGDRSILNKLAAPEDYSTDTKVDAQKIFVASRLTGAFDLNNRSVDYLIKILDSNSPEFSEFKSIAAYFLVHTFYDTGGDVEFMMKSIERSKFMDSYTVKAKVLFPELYKQKPSNGMSYEIKSLYFASYLVALSERGDSLAITSNSVLELTRAYIFSKINESNFTSITSGDLEEMLQSQIKLALLRGVASTPEKLVEKNEIYHDRLVGLNTFAVSVDELSSFGFDKNFPQLKDVKIATMYEEANEIAKNKVVTLYAFSNYLFAAHLAKFSSDTEVNNQKINMLVTRIIGETPFDGIPAKFWTKKHLLVSKSGNYYNLYRRENIAAIARRNSGLKEFLSVKAGWTKEDFLLKDIVE